MSSLPFALVAWLVAWPAIALFMFLRITQQDNKVRQLREGQAQWRKAAERDLQEIQRLTYELAEANRLIHDAKPIMEGNLELCKILRETLM